MHKQSKSHKLKMLGRKAGTAFAIGPCMPIILCALLAYEDLAEPKWQMLQVQKNNRVTNQVKLPQRDSSLTCGSASVFMCQNMWVERSRRRDRKQHADSGSVTAIRTPGVKSKRSSQEGTIEGAETCETFEPKIKTECQMEQRGSGEAITNGKTSFRYQSWFQELMNYYCCWWLFFHTRLK